MNDDKTLISKYGAALRTVMSAIPVLSPLATAWSEFESSKNEKRLQLFIDCLNAITSVHSKEIDAIKNDTSKIEERVALLEVTLDKVVKEWQPTKVKLHAQLFVGNMISDDPIQLKMSILERFSELSIDDLNILAKLTTDSSIQVSELNGSLNDLIPSLSKLESRGLITQTGPGARSIFTTASSSDNWQRQWQNKFYTSTPLGTQLWTALNKIK